MMKNFIRTGCMVLLLAACNNDKSTQDTKASDTPRVSTSTVIARKPDSPLKEVPILCYHRIVPSGKPTDYTISISMFNEHIKMLSDSGYHAIQPKQLLAYLTAGGTLPPKPVIISFDDTREEHFSVAAPVLKRYGYKGVYFIMTVAIGKPGYMGSEQIKALADSGNTIGSHTYDHQDVRKLAPGDWEKQLHQSRLRLEQVTGNKINFFAYPFGLWNDSAVAELKRSGVEAAFQLTQKRSGTEPVLTIRRLLVPGYWNAHKLSAYMRGSFH